MQIFKLSERFSIVCRSEGTRYGFRHLAELMSNGYSTGKTAKCCYYNRTWERYPFQTVLYLLIEKVFNEEEIKKYKEIIG